MNHLPTSLTMEIAQQEAASLTGFFLMTEEQRYTARPLEDFASKFHCVSPKCAVNQVHNPFKFVFVL